MHSTIKADGRAKAPAFAVCLRLPAGNQHAFFFGHAGESADGHGMVGRPLFEFVSRHGEFCGG